MPAKAKADQDRQVGLHFGDGKAEGRADMKDLLGGKGANLAEMANLGLPVPPGFTITTEVCTYYYAHDETYPADLQAQVEAALDARRRASPASAFGDAANPLLVSVRSGARASMPGMMDTVLNLGLNDETVEALAQAVGRPRASPTTATAASSRCIRTWCSASSTTSSRRSSTSYKDRKGYTLDTELDGRRLDRRWSRATRTRREARLGKPTSRRTRTSSSGARSARCSARG